MDRRPSRASTRAIGRASPRPSRSGVASSASRRSASRTPSFRKRKSICSAGSRPGRHGDMAYMARHGTARSRPAELVPGTIRVISARMNYWPRDAAPAHETLEDPSLAYVSRYALGRDYHKVLRAQACAAGRAHRARKWDRSAFACSPTPRRCSKSRSPPRPAWAGAASTRSCSRATSARIFFSARSTPTCRCRRRRRRPRTAARARRASPRVRRAPSSRRTSSTRAAASRT